MWIYGGIFCCGFIRAEINWNPHIHSHYSALATSSNSSAFCVCYVKYFCVQWKCQNVEFVWKNATTISQMCAHSFLQITPFNTHEHEMKIALLRGECSVLSAHRRKVINSITWKIFLFLFARKFHLIIMSIMYLKDLQESWFQGFPEPTQVFKHTYTHCGQKISSAERLDACFHTARPNTLIMMRYILKMMRWSATVRYAR